MGTREANGHGSTGNRTGGRKGKRAAIRYIDANGVPRRAWVYAPDLDTLETKRQELAEQIRRYGRPSRTGVGTVAEYLTEWVEVHARNHDWSDGTRQRYTDALEHYAIPFFIEHRTPLKRVRMVDVARLAQKLETLPGRRAGTTLSANTRGAVLIALRAAFDDATRPGIALMTDNPARLVKLPKGRSRTTVKRRALEADEKAAMLAAADKAHIGALVRFLLYTGARCEDAAALSWSDIDLDNGAAILRGEKTEAAWERPAVLTPELVRVLREHKRAQAARQLAAHSWADPDAVFTRNDGTRVTKQYVSERIRDRCPWSAHYLRHTFITAAIRAGIPLPDIAAQVGHENPAYMLKQYGSKTNPGAVMLRETMDAALAL